MPNFRRLRQLVLNADDIGRRPHPVTGNLAITDHRPHVLLGIGDAGATGLRGLLFQAHNKIKHRFMVIEDIETVGATPGDPVRFGHLPRNPAMVMRLGDNIAQVALSTGELAALLLMLDQAGGADAE